MQFSNRKIIFVLFCLGNIAISFNFAALAAAVPVISHALGVSDILVSSISAYYMIPYGLGALIYAPLARKISLKVILVSCMALYALTSFVSAAVNSIYVILIMRVLGGLAAASMIPLCLISIGTNFSKETRGRLVGLFFSTSFIASVVGIVVSGVCDWRWLFWIPGIGALVTAVLILRFADGILGPLTVARIDYRRVWFDLKLRKVMLFIFAISFLYHGVHKWFGVYLHREYGLDQFAISFYFVLIAIFGAIGQNVGGYVTDKMGRYVACHRGVLILAVSTMLLIGKYPLFVLALIFACFSIGWTIGHNGVSTVLTDFPDESRAEIAGLNSAVRFLSGGLGFFVGGPFVEHDFGLTFLGFGIVMFVSSLFLKKIIIQD